MKIRTRVIFGFSAVAVLLIFVAIAGFWGVNSMNDLFDEYALTEGRLVEYAQSGRANINTLRRFEKDAFINIASAEKVTEYNQKWQSGLQDTQQRLDAMEQLLAKLDKGGDAEFAKRQSQTLKEMRALLNDYTTGFNAVVGRIRTGEIKTTADANQAINVYKEAIHKMEALTGRIAEECKKEMDGGVVRAQQFENRIRITIVAVSLVALFAAVALALAILRAISRPLNEMLAMVTDIARGEGDLTKRLNTSSRDEVAEIAAMFNLFVEKLHGIISNVAMTTSQVATAAHQLNSTATQIATGAEQVASQSITIATAGEEMSATSQDIAQNCQFAAGGAKLATDAALSGSQVVQETIVVMNGIADRVKHSAKAVESLGSRSDQIGEIVGTIEDIADQTNLLALNAAIEAARAGEQGRGFAVVADEVRALAERTTNATREISEMIKAIQKETQQAVFAMEEGVRDVSCGSEKAGNSGLALEKILEQINSVTSEIHQVATAAEEQTATTSEISNNMHQITSVISRAARGAHETATAANQLVGLSEGLRRVVGQFRLV